MPTPPNDIARRLQEISTLLRIIRVMRGEFDRGEAVHHLHSAVEALCDVPEDNHDIRSRMVRSLMRLIRKLEAHVDLDTDDDIQFVLEVIEWITKSVVTYKLQMPTYTDLKGNALMANFALPLDKKATFAITEFNKLTNTFDPVDPADVFTLVNSDTTNLNAVIGVTGTGTPALVVNWLHTVDPLLTDVSVSVSDSLGNLADVQLFDMVQPAHVPDQIGLDIAGVAMEDQPIPT